MKDRDDDRRNVHRLVVKNYLAMVGFVWEASTQSPSAAQRKQLARCAAHLRNARIFELCPRAYIALDHLADEYVTEQIGGEKWCPAGTGEPSWEGSGSAYLAKVMAAAQRVAYPERWPFEVCYFAIGGTGIGCGACRSFEIHEQHKKGERHGMPLTPPDPAGPSTGVLLAIVATATGDVFELLADRYRPGADPLNIYVFDRRTSAGDWEATAINLGYPWLLPALLDAINANDTVIEADMTMRLADRLAAQKLGKAIRHSVLPPLYYRVFIQPQKLTEKPRWPSRPREWSHRWQVRGHWYTKVARGSIPLDPKLYSKLLKRGYAVFHALHPMTAAAATVLLRRHIAPPGAGEWVAVLRGWREEFRQGAEGPAVHSQHVPAAAHAARGDPAGQKGACHMTKDEQRELMRRALDGCVPEAARIIADGGQHLPMLLPFDAEGHCCGVYGFQMPETTEGKEAMLEALAERVLAPAEVAFYVLVVEGWAIRRAQVWPHERPSRAPDRVEVVTMDAWTRDGVQLFRTLDIQRPVDGTTGSTLVRYEADMTNEGPGRSEGTFVNLFRYIKRAAHRRAVADSDRKN